MVVGEYRQRVSSTRTRERRERTEGGETKKIEERAGRAKKEVMGSMTITSVLLCVAVLQ